MKPKTKLIKVAQHILTLIVTTSLLGCSENKSVTLVADSGVLNEQASPASIETIKKDLSETLSASGSLVLCKHSTLNGKIKCVVQKVLKKNPSFQDSPYKIGDPISKHERPLRTQELPLDGEMSIFTPNGVFIESMGIHQSSIKRVKKNSNGQFEAHLFEVQTLINNY